MENFVFCAVLIREDLVVAAAQCISKEFREIFKRTFFIEHLLWLLLKSSINSFYISEDCGLLPAKQFRLRKNEYIIDGTDSMDGQWPWQAAIFLNDTFHCGGTLIKEEVVVTAAQCIISRNAAEYKVILGKHETQPLISIFV